MIFDGTSNGESEFSRFESVESVSPLVRQELFLTARKCRPGTCTLLEGARVRRGPRVCVRVKNTLAY